MPPSIYSQACLLILSFHSIDRRTARAHVPIRATTLSSSKADNKTKREQYQPGVKKRQT